MPEFHRLVVDRHEGELAVVQLDGGAFLDLPRWMLPAGARADDVLAATVTAEPERVTIAIVRDQDATARARAAAGESIARLRSREREP